MKSTTDLFLLNERVVVITGGGGMLGNKHAEAVLDAGGIPVLLDISEKGVSDSVERLQAFSSSSVGGFVCDITSDSQVRDACASIVSCYGRVDVLINNAANNPKVENTEGANFDRLENFSMKTWGQDISVGLTGAMLCSRAFAAVMAERGKGVILNIASDLALIAPDQRIYRRDECSEKEQLVKPVTYSVVKAGLLGLTKYCATYYAKDNIRCNALAPGGVYAGQDDDFVSRLANLIPMGRMAHEDELKGAVLYLISDASQYVTGACLSVDGGRTCW